MSILISLTPNNTACVDTFSYNDIGYTHEFVESFVRNKAERIAHDLAIPFYDELELNRSLSQVDLFAA